MCYVTFVKKIEEGFTFSSYFQVLELQATNAELQKKLLLMEKDIVGKDPVDSQKEPDLINLSTPIKVLKVTVKSFLRHIISFTSYIRCLEYICAKLTFGLMLI